MRFFGRTYLPEGLRDLLTRAVRRVGGDANAAPVLNLQTTFGGGKTHSMLALYHLFSGHPVTSFPEEVEKLLSGTDLGRLGSEVNRVTLVGHHLSAASGMPKDDGTGVAQVLDLITWEREGFALASGYDQDAGRYDGLVLPHEGMFGQITDATLLVAPGLATEQRRAELAQRPDDETAGGGNGTEATAGAGADGTSGGEASEATGGTATGTKAPGPARPGNTRFFGVYKLNTDRHAKDFRKLSDEVIPHLADEDTELEIRVEIHAHNKDGFDESTVRTVSENARTLTFEQSQFEDT